MTQLSLHTLRGKQSVRVTFKLAPETIDLLSVMAMQLGIKQKTLFDHLIERQELLNHLHQTTKPEENEHPRRQKTFVLSQETLQTLNILAEKYHAPRNLLVEMAVQRLLPILTEEQEKHEKRKTVLKKIAKKVKQGRELLAEAEDILGSDDPVCLEIREANQGWENAHQKILSIIERGRGMEKL
jgi:predicted transcriptional regulator